MLQLTATDAPTVHAKPTLLLRKRTLETPITPCRELVIRPHTQDACAPGASHAGPEAPAHRHGLRPHQQDRSPGARQECLPNQQKCSPPNQQECSPRNQECRPSPSASRAQNTSNTPPPSHCPRWAGARGTASSPGPPPARRRSPGPRTPRRRQATAQQAGRRARGWPQR